MFLFKCCQEVRSGHGYEIVQVEGNNKITTKFVDSIDQLQPNVISNPATKIIKMNKSDYDEVYAGLKGTNKKFQDPQFPPNQRSLGNLDGVTVSKWKRISEILQKPVLFDGKIEPRDVIQGSLGDCYFLSALASLAQNQSRIKQIFGNQQYNPCGIYKIQLRIQGQIEQIIVDDFVPVNENGEPLFCQPNKNEFWVLILQKAWAKAHGSYANIVAGMPTEVFKAVTFAPAQMLIVKESAADRDNLWGRILAHSARDYPCCCGTDDSPEVDWQSIKIAPGHAYTLINAAQLQDDAGRMQKMLKLRNPWGQRQWEGEGNQNDKAFWNRILPTNEKKQFLSDQIAGNDGVFYMKYTDFCQYFTQVHFCLLEPTANYISQPMFPAKKNGTLYEVTLSTAGTYIFQLHQSSARSELSHGNKKEDGLSRTTLLLIKQNGGTGKEMEYINGIMKYNQEDTALKVDAVQGKYLLFAKIDPSRSDNLLPSKASVSVYSHNFAKVQLTEQKKYPSFLQQAFLSHARLNKRNRYNNDLMWISWKLLFQQGGYAYIAMGNSSQSTKKFIINFDESEFTKMGFKLKKTYKRKGEGQIVEVNPGEEKIILARVKNQMIKSLKFPPPLGIKMEVI